jgi:hypothetical protein
MVFVTTMLFDNARFTFFILVLIKFPMARNLATKHFLTRFRGLNVATYFSRLWSRRMSSAWSQGAGGRVMFTL